jgi:hypothetical protein
MSRKRRGISPPRLLRGGAGGGALRFLRLRDYLAIISLTPHPASASSPEFAGLSANFHFIPKYVWEWMGARMRVDEKVRQSVVFIGVNGSAGFIPLGTGLLGLAMCEDMGNCILITAKHVVDSIHGDAFAVRINRRDGGTECKTVHKAATIAFDNKGLDLAIFPFSLGNPTEYEASMIPLTSDAWNWQIEALGEPSPGDEVCVVGLYTTHYGHIKNIPVVRIGHIAALPEEQVMTDQGYVLGYLIECHSIAGFSGSPVYWTVPPLHFKAEQKRPMQFPNYTYVPLGILIGYHVIESKEDAILVPQFQIAEEDRDYGQQSEKTEERRTGFGVVIPIQHVFKVFEGEWMQKLMRENIQDIRRKSGYRKASAMPTTDVPSASAVKNGAHMPEKDEKYSPEESERRFEAALRGARLAEPLPMKAIPPKRPGKAKNAASKKRPASES